MTGTSEIQEWGDLMVQQMEAATELVLVKAKVNLELKNLEGRMQLMATGAEIIERFFGAPEGSDNDNGNALSPVGRVLDQYL